MSDEHVRAAVFSKPNTALRLLELRAPTMGPGESLVAIECCTLCGSDLHTFRGDRPAPDSLILGHEIVGRITEHQPDASELCDVRGSKVHVGDRVVWSLAVGCGNCFFCKNGISQKCESLFKYGHESIDRWALGGGLADCCHLLANTPLVKIPESMPARVACLASCATATVVAAFESAGNVAGRNVLIFGAGTLGIHAAAMARSRGASQVIITDLLPERLALASRFGATATLLLEDPSSLENEIISLTKHGADIVFEMCGAPEAVETAMQVARIGGTVVLVGSVFPARSVSLAADHLVRRLLRIFGVHNYNPMELMKAVSFLEDTLNEYPWPELIPQAFQLSDVNQAIQTALRSDAARVAITP